MPNDVYSPPAPDMPLNWGRLPLFCLMLVLVVFIGACSKRQAEVHAQAGRVQQSIRRYEEKYQYILQRNKEVRDIRHQWLTVKLAEVLPTTSQWVLQDDSLLHLQFQELERAQRYNESAHNQLIVDYTTTLDQIKEWLSISSTANILPADIRLHWQEVELTLQSLLVKERQFYRATEDWEPKAEQFLEYLKAYQPVYRADSTSKAADMPPETRLQPEPPNLNLPSPN
jgi:hypothetical protein